MKYKIRQAGKTQKVVEIHISKETFCRELDRIYLEITKTASLPGFRIGKAPIETVKKRYKKEATGEAVRSLLVDSFKKAVAESDIDMLGLPEISDLQFDEQKGISYKATVNIRPQLRLKGYKGLSLQKNKNEIKESDIDLEINNLRQMHAKFLTKDGEALPNDYVVCNVECYVENQPVEKKENVWLYVSDNSFIPGKSLEGLKVDDEKDVEKLLPKDYSKKEAAGKKANFHIKVKEIKEKILPELNDEFASAVGGFRNLMELREAVRETIRKRNELEEKHNLKNQALQLLDKIAAFDAPQFIVDKYYQTLVNETKDRLKNDGFSEEEIKSMEANFSQRLKKEALREVRAHFILEEIAKLEKITTEDGDIENTFNAIASSSSRSVEDVRRYYTDNDLIEDLIEDIKQRKVLDFVIKNANIT